MVVVTDLLWTGFRRRGGVEGSLLIIALTPRSARRGMPRPGAHLSTCHGDPEGNSTVAVRSRYLHASNSSSGILSPFLPAGICLHVAVSPISAWLRASYSNTRRPPVLDSTGLDGWQPNLGAASHCAATL